MELLVVGEGATGLNLSLLVAIGEGNGAHLTDDILTLSMMRSKRGWGWCGFVVLPAGREWNENKCRKGECQMVKACFHSACYYYC